MDKIVPAWLIALVVVASLGAAVLFGIFLHNHTRVAAYTEQSAYLRDQITDVLQAERGRYQDATRAINDEITVRRLLIAELDRIESDETSLITDIHSQQRQAEEAIESLLESRLKTLREAYQDATAARQEMINQQITAIESQRDAAQQLVRQRAKINERQQELAATRRSQRDQILELEAVVADRRERRDELLDRRDDASETLASDGTILSAQVTDGFVIIDRGLDQDLPVGLNFAVYNRQGGRIVPKGEIEVIEVEANWATARVISELDANNPIIPGDHIHNPIYNPDEQKIYVIAGSFQRFSPRELRRFIEQAGGRVEPEITERTHYLVAGEGVEDILEEASLNGVIILSERKLLDLVRSEDRFRVRQGMVFAVVGDFTAADAGDVRRWVEINGGVVVSAVSQDVDVLLVGEGENVAAAISEARLQGATIIDQSQLVHLMGSSSTPVAE